VTGSGLLATMGIGLVASCAAACAREPQLPPAAQLAARAAPPPPAGSLVLRAGEQMRWRLRVGAFGGGSMQVSSAAASRTKGRNVAVVRTRFATSGLVALFDDSSSDDTTWVDLDAARPLRYRSEADGDDGRSSLDALFDRDAVRMVERRADGARRRVHQQVPGEGAPLNMIAALLVLRAWPERAASAATLSVWARSRLWRITVRRTGAALVKTPLGQRRAHRIEGLAWRTRRDGSPDPDSKSRRFRLYVSADRDRLPVLVETHSKMGTVRAELVEYRRPRGSAISTRDREGAGRAAD
jgi:Protein of unknown function (DUF3108)